MKALERGTRRPQGATEAAEGATGPAESAARAAENAPDAAESAADRGVLLPAERVLALSDGVFAVAATLLVVDVRLPRGLAAFDWDALGAISANILGYVISFLVAGQLWIAYQRKMRFVERVDMKAVWLNLLFLMVVAFIPFTTSTLSEYGNRQAVILYALVFIAASLMLAAFWLYLCRHPGWLKAGQDSEAHRRERRRGWLPPLVFLASIPIAFVDPDWAMYCWLLLAPLGMLMKRR